MARLKLIQANLCAFNLNLQWNVSTDHRVLGTKTPKGKARDCGIVSPALAWSSIQPLSIISPMCSRSGIQIFSNSSSIGLLFSPKCPTTRCCWMGRNRLHRVVSSGQLFPLAVNIVGGVVFPHGPRLHILHELGVIAKPLVRAKSTAVHTLEPTIKPRATKIDAINWIWVV